ncbi:MAG: carbohydrate porin [Planctomycetes bacterium]|nr:carbohydrate porin [Planctomycetota bacterium]
MLGTAIAQDVPAGLNTNQGPGMTSDPLDPVVELHRIQERRVVSETRSSLFRTSPLTPLRGAWLRAEQRLYEATDIKFGTAFNHLFQQLDRSFPGEDTFGMSTNMTLVGTWELFHKGHPNQGEVTLGIDGRWGYGLEFPTNLGPNSLGSLGFTANPYGEYNPSFIVRNLFWRQGSRDAGWLYRIGHITPDQFLNTSAHINPNGTYLPILGTGGFSMALPDSGWGMAAGVFLNDRVNLAGLVSDANANRFTMGDLGEGDLFTALELQAKIMPLTKNAGYSKITFWHNDGTKDGLPLNGSSGNEGWGIFVKHEQELTCDGRAIAIGRWGKGFNESALYDQLVGAHFLLYDPFCSGQYSDGGLIHADVIGAAYNWVQPTAVGARDESNVELFYRFPLFPYTDMTLSYQAIIHPALDPNNDFASVFSLRFRSTF